MKTFVDLFRKPSVEQLILQELQDATRAKLEAETAREYADSLVTYNNARITRLTGRLKEVIGEPALVRPSDLT
jgi:FixJ family two-component response regulator